MWPDGWHSDTKFLSTGAFAVTLVIIISLTDQHDWPTWLAGVVMALVVVLIRAAAGLAERRRPSARRTD
jgi:uncharacterized membrane protein YjdF